MNSTIYHAGIMLKRFIEGSGRRPTLEHYITLAWLKAEEDGVDLDTFVQKVILTKDYHQNDRKEKLDRGKRLTELGF